MNLPNILGLPVEVIDGVPVFDCRISDDEPTPVAPWGEHLWGTERAAYTTLTREGWAGNDTTPLSISGTPDLRKWPEQYQRVARDLVARFKEAERDYTEALADPAAPDDGGSIFYKPVCVAVCNYGASIIADRRHRAVRRFR